jgi:hypothetical protein
MWASRSYRTPHSPRLSSSETLPDGARRRPPRIPWGCHGRSPVPPRPCLTPLSLSWRVHQRRATRAPHPAASGAANASPRHESCATGRCSCGCVGGGATTAKTSGACYCCGSGCTAWGCGHWRNLRKGKRGGQSPRRRWRGGVVGSLPITVVPMSSTLAFLVAVSHLFPLLRLGDASIEGVGGCDYAAVNCLRSGWTAGIISYSMSTVELLFVNY